MRLTTAVGKTGREGGAGAGDQWVKSGDWELEDHMIELCCFDFKLKWVKVTMRSITEAILIASYSYIRHTRNCPDSKTDLTTNALT